MHLDMKHLTSSIASKAKLENLFVIRRNAKRVVKEKKISKIYFIKKS